MLAGMHTHMQGHNFRYFVEKLLSNASFSSVCKKVALANKEKHVRKKYGQV